MLSIYNYRDPVDYISSVLNEYKKNESSFSLKTFSTEIGLNSTAPLIDILKRKKPIKDKIAYEIAKRFNIDSSEMVYFNAIVSMAQNTDKNKNTMYELLNNDLAPNSEQEFSSFRTSTLDIFSHWIFMAILSLSELRDFDLTVENIKRKLIEDVDESQIESAIKSLIYHKLLIFDDNGKIQKRYLRNSTKTNVSNKSAHIYYGLVCDLAKKAIKVPLDKREFCTFSFPIANKDLPIAKEIIRKCRNNLSKLSEGAECDEVYQANLMLFPLTDGL